MGGPAGIRSQDQVSPRALQRRSDESVSPVHGSFPCAPQLSSTVGTTLAPAPPAARPPPVSSASPTDHPHVYSRQRTVGAGRVFSACVRHTAGLCASSLPALPCGRRRRDRDSCPWRWLRLTAGPSSAAAAAAAEEQRVQPRQLLGEDRAQLATQADEFKWFFINNHFTLQG